MESIFQQMEWRSVLESMYRQPEWPSIIRSVLADKPSGLQPFCEYFPTNRVALNLLESIFQQTEWSSILESMYLQPEWPSILEVFADNRSFV
ncbi:hypothetical protein BLX87_20930 [Bacillus sp. VT-16-64]|nr:hypothetical protein BLX87_20930 [Bacillus sp. VT-16-64]